MITSAENRGWPSDVPVTGLMQAGLPAPSVIRTAKIATIGAADVTRLGDVSAACIRKALAAIGGDLGLQV